MNRFVEKAILDAGADLVGYADLGREILSPEIAHLSTAVSIGIGRSLNESTLAILDSLISKASAMLKRKGYRYLAIPPVYRGNNRRFVAKLYPLFTHRIAATSAGLGWIGRNGLLVNARYGPRLSFATVLTDAPLHASNPVKKCHCGGCSLCVSHCPAQALTGADWSREDPFVRLVNLHRCRNYKTRMKALTGKPNCGLCINICPHGRKKRNMAADFNTVSC